MTKDTPNDDQDHSIQWRARNVGTAKGLREHLADRDPPYKVTSKQARTHVGCAYHRFEQVVDAWEWFAWATKQGTRAVQLTEAGVEAQREADFGPTPERPNDYYERKYDSDAIAEVEKLVADLGNDE